jgi:hypothetical protein
MESLEAAGTSMEEGDLIWELEKQRDAINLIAKQTCQSEGTERG